MTRVAGIAFILCLVIVACSNKHSPPAQKEEAPKPGVDLAAEAASNIKEEADVLYISVEPEKVPEQTIEVGDVQLVIVAKPNIPPIEDGETALDATLKGFQARGQSIDQCNAQIRQLAERLDLEIN